MEEDRHSTAQRASQLSQGPAGRLLSAIARATARRLGSVRQAGPAPRRRISATLALVAALALAATAGSAQVTTNHAEGCSLRDKEWLIATWPLDKNDYLNDPTNCKPKARNPEFWTNEGVDFGHSGGHLIQTSLDEIVIDDGSEEMLHSTDVVVFDREGNVRRLMYGGKDDKFAMQEGNNNAGVKTAFWKNPKDPRITLLITNEGGGYYTFNSHQDGWVYFVHKASGNKPVCVYEENTQISFRHVIDNKNAGTANQKGLPEVIDYTLPTGSDGRTFDETVWGTQVGGEDASYIYWPQTIAYKQMKPMPSIAMEEKQVYADDDPQHIYAPIGVRRQPVDVKCGGPAVILFRVFANHTYTVVGFGTKLMCGGYFFDHQAQHRVISTGRNKVLFYEPKSALKAVAAPAEAVDGRTYDLLGRRVEAASASRPALLIRNRRLVRP